MAKEIYFYSKSKKYSWLSNFYPVYFKLNNRNWPTVEHYFQAMKTENIIDQERIRCLEEPKLAKHLGRSVELRPDWEEIKEDVMREALYAKFTQSEKLKEKLLATGDAILHENSPYDKYWGVHGKDRLGILLMELREKLKGE